MIRTCPRAPKWVKDSPLPTSGRAGCHYSPGRPASQSPVSARTGGASCFSSKLPATFPRHKPVTHRPNMQGLPGLLQSKLLTLNANSNSKRKKKKKKAMYLVLDS